MSNIDKNKRHTQYEVPGNKCGRECGTDKESVPQEGITVTPRQEPITGRKGDPLHEKVGRAYTVLTTERERYDQMIAWSGAKPRKYEKGTTNIYMHIYANINIYTHTPTLHTKEEKGNVHGAWKGAGPALNWTAEPPGNRDTHSQPGSR